MPEYTWRFADNNYGQENGLDTGDVETFKKDPVSSAARETCQNAIDAAIEPYNPLLPVRVEYTLFDINTNDIPGIQELTYEIDKCYEYKKDSEKEKKALRSIWSSIHSTRIKCLRISDFNTTGLLGVKNNERKSPFYNLTKGSGVSDKNGTTGGSKGIGKFASFVISTTKTVFYSTRTKDGEVGYIGICKLRSRPFEKDPDLMTQGIGYFAKNEKNLPILESFSLDPSFTRDPSNFGTDIYIIGFNNEPGWEGDIIAKVLDSFMVAIVEGRIEVCVDGIELNKDTIKDILLNSDILMSRGKRERKDIMAQFELLSEGEGVSKADLKVGDEENAITVYVKQYKSKDEANATRHCVMVRYPYMKIKHITGYSYLPYSALCIIRDNELNKKLRAIENPQHIDWEIKRLNDDPDEKRITRELKSELESTVGSYIEEILRQSSGESTDIEGAGDYLPSDIDDGDVQGGSSGNEDETVIATPIKPVITTTPKTQKAGESGESYEFGEGAEGEGDDTKVPGEGGENPNPNPNPDHEPKDEDQGNGGGDKPVLKKVALSGMKYKNIVVDKRQGRYDVVFTSLYDEAKCELLLRQYGESTDKYPITILSASMNGDPCEVKDGKIIGFSLSKGKKYKITYQVSMKELFASEVIINAYR